MSNFKIIDKKDRVRYEGLTTMYGGKKLLCTKNLDINESLEVYKTVKEMVFGLKIDDLLTTRLVTDTGATFNVLDL